MPHPASSLLPVSSLLYVSVGLLRPEEQKSEIDDIVGVARSRNEELGVTGALVYTGEHFAQVLEGSASAVDELMTSICRDPRHAKVDIVEVVDIAERRFTGWSMAYCGPSLYVDRHIRPLFKDIAEPGTRTAGAASLIRLMQAFAGTGGVYQER
ncbi:MAG TPA: BLUF domain-containing protein [Allosphingosinicella sp.]|nr:BLUF domain-containing protein [Allosphingosinicella sp.]